MTPSLEPSLVRPDKDLTADPEPILYDERNPQSAVVLRHIPGHIEVDDGRLTDGRRTESLFNPYNDLWIPVLCVGAWWLFLCRRGRVSSWTRRGFHRFRVLGR